MRRRQMRAKRCICVIRGLTRSVGPLCVCHWGSKVYCHSQKLATALEDGLDSGEGSLSRNRVYVLGYPCLVLYNISLLRLFHDFSSTLIAGHRIHKRQWPANLLE